MFKRLEKMRSLQLSQPIRVSLELKDCLVQFGGKKFAIFGSNSLKMHVLCSIDSKKVSTFW